MHVTQLWRYPVKSFLGERLETLELDDRGVRGDRLFAIRDANGKLGSGKTTRRFQRIPGLFDFSAHYDGDVPVIRFPDGIARRGDDPGVHAALSASLGQPVTLLRENAISHFDQAPIHLVTTSSLRWLQRRLEDATIDPRRFRPNLVIETEGAGLLERDWEGRVLRIGEVRLRILHDTERCLMVGLRQNELPPEPGLLRELASSTDACFGRYAAVEAAGRISVGDPVA